MKNESKKFKPNFDLGNIPKGYWLVDPDDLRNYRDHPDYPIPHRDNPENKFCSFDFNLF